MRVNELHHLSGKKGWFILTLMLIGSMILKGQQYQKVSFSLNYNPGMSYRILANNPTLEFTLNDLEEPLMVHGAEFQLDFPLNRKLGLITGLGFVSYGEKVTMDFNEISFPDENDPYYGFVYESFEVSPGFDYTLRYYHNYLSVPVILRWTLMQKRSSSMSLQAGLTANFHLYSRQRNVKKFDSGEMERSSNNYDVPARSFAPGAVLGLMYKVDLGEKSFLQFGPKFDMLIMNMYATDYVNRLPYRAGISLGFGIM